jgi:2,6-dihydroxypyridine 3-monooxygenase
VAHERQHTYHFSSWNTVYRHLRELFPDDRYLLGHEVLSHEQSDESVRILLGTGDTVDADLLVCADGVSSRFRDHFLPNAHRAYAGYVAWRGMVPESELPADVAESLGDAITYYLYANSQILVYPIPGADGSLSRGDRLINYVWYRNYKEGDDLADLMTDTHGQVQDTSLPPGHVRDMHVNEMRAHAQARLPRVISTVIQATAQPFLQVVYDLAINRMAFGRVCLIGDAAVVMRPHAAAGTAKAAANAWALAQALTNHDTVPEALAAWEPGEVAMGYQLAQRTQRLGYRSQVLSNWDSPEDDTLFRLRDEGP